jgi:hypothetical protein
MMSTSFRLLQSVRACDLFDGRLEEFGISEHVKPEKTTKWTRCLTDGRNYLWVSIDDDGFVSSLTRWAPNGDPSEILNAIAVTLDADIVSEYQPQYFGFDTVEEWCAEQARDAREYRKKERKFEKELLKYVRGEPHNIKPETQEETKAKIAKKLAVEDPTLLFAENRKRFRSQIQSIYGREVLKLPF